MKFDYNIYIHVYPQIFKVILALCLRTALKKNTTIYFYELVQNKYFLFLICDHPYIKVSVYVELFLRCCNQRQL
jgi:hypothetical protein